MERVSLFFVYIYVLLEYIYQMPLYVPLGDMMAYLRNELGFLLKRLNKEGSEVSGNLSPANVIAEDKMKIKFVGDLNSDFLEWHGIHPPAQISFSKSGTISKSSSLASGDPSMLIESVFNSNPFALEVSSPLNNTINSLGITTTYSLPALVHQHLTSPTPIVLLTNVEPVTPAPSVLAAAPQLSCVLINRFTFSRSFTKVQGMKVIIMLFE
jgi:hypothetical protein